MNNPVVQLAVVSLLAAVAGSNVFHDRFASVGDPTGAGISAGVFGLSAAFLFGLYKLTADRRSG